MRVEKFDLYKYFNKEKGENQRADLTIYIQENWHREDKKRPAMLVLAGGGYRGVSAREQEPVIVKFLAQGYNVFSLDYSVAPVGYPSQLLEAAMAMAFIRENAKEFFIFADKLGVIGFSAGGHLACSIGTLYKDQVIKDYLGERASLCRPDVMVLCYSVILSGEYAHKGSIDVLSKGDEEIVKKVGLDNNVDSETPPTFLWHTGTDGAVPVENSLFFAKKLRDNGVKFELHVFEDGDHGLSVATLESNRVHEHVQKWVELCLRWLKKNGFELEA